FKYFFLMSVFVITSVLKLDYFFMNISNIGGDALRSIASYLGADDHAIVSTLNRLMHQVLKENRLVTSLDLSCLGPSNENLKSFCAQFPNLVHVNLKGCVWLTREGLASVSALPRLRHLDLGEYGNLRDGEKDDDLALLKGTRLQS